MLRIYLDQRDLIDCPAAPGSPVSRRQRGGNSPNLRTFVALCYALGADPTEVLREVLANSAQFQRQA